MKTITSTVETSSMAGDVPIVMMDPIVHAIGGSLGSTLALVVLYPLERARIEMQASCLVVPAIEERGNQHIVYGSPSSHSSNSSSESWTTAGADLMMDLQEENINDSSTPPSSGGSTWRSTNSIVVRMRQSLEQTNDSNEDEVNDYNSTNSTTCGTTAYVDALQNQEEQVPSEDFVTILPGGSSSSTSCNNAPVTTNLVLRSHPPASGGCHENVSIPRPISMTLSHCLRNLASRGELYRGLQPIAITMAMSQFVFFYLHEWFKTQLRRRLGSDQSRWMLLLASALAGTGNVLLTNPLWVANLRLATGEATTSSLMDEILVLIQKYGVGYLWSGTGSSILLVSNPVIQFFVYEQLKQLQLYYLLKQDGVAATATRTATSTTPMIVPKATIALNAWRAFVTGAVAKTVATILTYPLQLTQSLLRLQSPPATSLSSPTFIASSSLPSSSLNATQVQTQLSSPVLPVVSGVVPRYKNIIHCLYIIYKRDGILGWYTGLQAKLLQTVLNAAFTFLTYEQIVLVLHGMHQSIVRIPHISTSSSK